MTKDVDSEIRKYRAKLTSLLQKRRKKKRRVQSTRGRGRPRVSNQKLEVARELAKEFPIEDVAFKLDVSLTSLKNYGIKRSKIPLTQAAAAT